jgi:hypothetical protein
MKTLNIKSEYKSLGEAVKASNMDLSYNEGLAWQRIKMIDKNCKRAFVMDNKSVWFIFSADIDIFQKFNPFHSCLHDGAFSIVSFDNSNINISLPIIPKNKGGRIFAKENGFLVASL